MEMKELNERVCIQFKIPAKIHMNSNVAICFEKLLLNDVVGVDKRRPARFWIFLCVLKDVLGFLVFFVCFFFRYQKQFVGGSKLLRLF